jgi:hypothetical protein
MRLVSSFALVLVAALAVPAFAQAPPAGTPTRIRGTVDKLADHTLTVRAREGGSVSVALAPDFKVRAVVAQTLADIKTGDVVGITSIKGPDGAQQAVEVHILPKNIPNLRTGQFPWDLGPGSLMTNGAVAQVGGPPQGRVLTLAYHGKQAEIMVPPGAPIVGFAPGDPSLLQPGAAVVVFAQKLPDGSLTAAAVTAEKDGVKPPM